MSIWNVLLFPYLVFRLFKLPLALFDYTVLSVTQSVYTGTALHHVKGPLFFSFLALGSFQDFLIPYLKQAHQIWPWLVGAAVIGGIITAVLSGLILACRKKRKGTSPEIQPLLTESEDYNNVSYQSHF